ncbi:MAG: hypothetical protein M3348_04775 [Acidobacteriota bacterium]|nr:hypothetical protein [Acidobacteriota bacterium]
MCVLRLARRINADVLLRRSTRVAALLLLSFSFAHGQALPPPDSNPPQTFQKAGEVPAGSSKAFEFGLSDFSYHVSANGNGRREGGGLVRRFNLRLDGGEEISRVYFSKYAGDLLLVCGVADGGGRAFVVRLEQPSMRARWKQRVPAYNFAAAREGDALYVAASGFVGRLNLATGAYLWKHDRPTPDGPPLFESFEQPEVRGDTVSFREAAAAGRPAKTLLVNKKTGKLIRIE